MKRANSHQNEKKIFNSNLVRIQNNIKGNSHVKNIINDIKNSNLNQIQVNYLNLNTLQTGDSNFNSNMKHSYLSKNDKSTNSNKSNFYSNRSKVTLSRNNTLDRIRSKYNNSGNNSKIIHSKEKSNVSSNTKNLIQNLKPIDKISNISHKPKIINDKLHNFNKYILNVPTKNENNNDKFSNIDPSIDKKYTKPSDKFQRVKYSDPFASTKKHKTNFGYVYSAGGIPCRIEHGSVHMKLKWDIEPENLDYDPILIVCFEGLMEVEHPFSFAARQCVREMMQSRRAKDKILPILSKIINPLRNALGINSDGMFVDTMEITRILSDVVMDNLNPYLHFFLQQINKRAFSIKFKEKVFDLLRILERNGGADALKEIKKKIPTYVSLL